MKFTIRDCIDTEYGRLYTFSAEHDDVTIIESEETEKRPTEFLGNNDIEFEAGALISGRKIWGCSDKRPGKIHKGIPEGRSGRHSRQTVKIKGNICYAVIISSWTEDSINLHPLDYVRKLSER